MDWLEIVKKNFFIGVVSNNHNPEYMKKVKLCTDFPIVFEARKPDVKITREFMKEHNLKAETTCFVGDRPLTDILCGKRLGCITILVDSITADIEKPIVVDADALKLVSTDLLDENIVVTPHKYEFMKLFGVDVPKKLDDKIELLSNLSREYNVTILLKDVVDVISTNDDYRLNKTGNQGMTIGGTGDLLAGLTVALATYNTPFVSACLASFILGRAADEVLEEKGFNYRVDDILSRIS